MDIGTANTTAMNLEEWIQAQMLHYALLGIWLATHYPALLKVRVI